MSTSVNPVDVADAALTLQELGESMRLAAAAGEFSALDPLDRERLAIVQRLLAYWRDEPDDSQLRDATERALRLALTDTEALLHHCREQQAGTRRALAELSRGGRVALHYAQAQS